MKNKFDYKGCKSNKKFEKSYLNQKYEHVAVQN